MKVIRKTLATALLFGMASAAATAQTSERKVLTIQGARAVIAAAVADAKAKSTTGVIAVVDDGGNLMALERLDGTFAAGANVSIGKARLLSFSSGLHVSSKNSLTRTVRDEL